MEPFFIYWVEIVFEVQGSGKHKSLYSYIS